jgi:hypothetical protein
MKFDSARDLSVSEARCDAQKMREREMTHRVAATTLATPALVAAASVSAYHVISMISSQPNYQAV